MKECNSRWAALMFDLRDLAFLVRCAIAEVRDDHEARWRVFYMQHRMMFDAAMSLAFVSVFLLGVLTAWAGLWVGHEGVSVCGSMAAGLGFAGLIVSQAGRH